MPPNDNICAGADNKLNKTGAQNDQSDSSANSDEGQVVINHNHCDTPIQKSTPSTQKTRGCKTNAEKLAEAGSQNGSLTEYFQERPADSTTGKRALIHDFGDKDKVEEDADDPSPIDDLDPLINCDISLNLSNSTYNELKSSTPVTLQHNPESLENSGSEWDTTIKNSNAQALQKPDTCPVHHTCQESIQKLQRENEMLRRWAEEQIGSLKAEISSLKEQVILLYNKSPPSNEQEQRRIPTIVSDRTPEDTTRLLNSLSYLKPQKVKHNTRVAPKQKRNDASVQSKSSTSHRSQVHDNNANQGAPQTTSSQSHNMRNDGADNTGRIRTTTRPEAMRAGELKFVMEERRRRRNNIVISGDTSSWNNQNQISQWLSSVFGVESCVRKIYQEKEAIIVTLESIDPKKVIMAQKNKLKGTNV